VLGLDRLQHVRDVGVGDPVRLVVLGGVDRQPVALLGVLVVPAVAGIVDQQVVVLGQLLAQVVERLEDVIARGVLEQRDVEAVPRLEDGRDRFGVGDRRRQLRQLGVVLDADDERVVLAEVEV